MKKITTSSATSIRPTYSSTGTEGWFEPNTIVTDDWLNDLQGMFLDLFSRVGVTPIEGEAGDRNLYDAILNMVTGISAPIPSGSTMMFFDSVVPAGWTLVADDTANNRMIRVVNTASSGGSFSGVDSPILNDKIVNHTHSINSQIITTTVASNDHTHSFSGNTSNASTTHSHSYTDRFYPESNPMDGSTWTPVPTGAGSGSTDFDNDWVKYVTDVSSQSGADHTHGFSGNTSGISANHTHTVTVPATNTNSPASPANWQPRYLNGILCRKI